MILATRDGRRRVRDRKQILRGSKTTCLVNSAGLSGARVGSSVLMAASCVTNIHLVYAYKDAKGMLLLTTADLYIALPIGILE